MYTHCKEIRAYTFEVLKRWKQKENHYCLKFPRYSEGNLGVQGGCRQYTIDWLSNCSRQNSKMVREAIKSPRRFFKKILKTDSQEESLGEKRIFTSHWINFLSAGLNYSQSLPASDGKDLETQLLKAPLSHLSVLSASKSPCGQY